MVLSAMPYYLLALILISIFAVGLRIFPPAGGYSPTLILGPNLKSVFDVAYHAILPSLSIVLGAIGFWAIGMRALMVGVLGEDYIVYAESKGLKPRRVFLRYGLRNSLLPQVTALAIVLGTVVSGRDPRRGDLRLPGLGGLLVASILGKDIFVINGIVTILIVTLGIAVFTIDLLLPVLDPRIRRRPMTASCRSRWPSLGRGAGSGSSTILGSRRQLIVGLVMLGGAPRVRDRRARCSSIRRRPSSAR